MSTSNTPESACGKVRRSLDSYVGGERDDSREIRRHLEGCPACNALAVGRERVRTLVRRAVRREPVPESLRAKVRELIRREAR